MNEITVNGKMVLDEESYQELKDTVREEIIEEFKKIPWFN